MYITFDIESPWPLLDRLLQNEKVNVSILTCQEKHLIIGWRERKKSSPLVGVQNKAMDVFLNNIPVVHAQQVITPEVQHGFDLIIVKYPKSYKWSLE